MYSRVYIQSIAARRTSRRGSEHRGESRPSRAPRLWKDTMFWTAKQKEVNSISTDLKPGPQTHGCLCACLHVQVVQVVGEHASGGCYSSLPLVVLSRAQPGLDVLPETMPGRREKGRKQNHKPTKEMEMTAASTNISSQTHAFTLKTLCSPSGLESLASTLFKSSCSAAKVSLYNSCVNSTQNVTSDNSSSDVMKRLVNHLSLLRVQNIILFTFLWRVCLGWEGNYAVHTHLQQVKALILA